MIPQYFGFICQIANLGYMGVDLFFVLSGFVISYNYADKGFAGSAKSWKQFMLMRFVRLYPVHLFTLLLSLGFFLGMKLIHLKTPKDFSGWTGTTFVTNLLMVHAWLPYVHDSWNNASWSVSCEWFVYLLFPILTWMIYKRLNLYWSIAVAFLMAIGPALVMAIKPDVPFLALIKVVFEFTSGCLAYSTYRLLKQNSNIFRFRIALWLLAFLVLATWLLIRLHNPAVDPAWLASIYPLAIVCWSLQRPERWSFLCSRLMLTWGQASYSLYMTHSVTLWLLKEFVHERPGLANLFVYSIWLIAIACAAYLTYKFVEEPSRVYLRKLASSPDAPSNVVLSR